MKIYLLIFLFILAQNVQAEIKSLDRYCSKKVDHLRLFFVNGMFTTADTYRKNVSV